MLIAYNKPSQREFYSLKNTHKISCLGRYNFLGFRSIKIWIFNQFTKRHVIVEQYNSNCHYQMGWLILVDVIAQCVVDVAQLQRRYL
ncbi:hypothetical protein ABA45_17870 [Marinobacter psychrophilus]|uniref:Uncharacterized protein n=1 Tax=Marinobacter psychrophilus TaxID=330734 RepID=A0A0H4I4Q8_9GAMM|nr:hypothetical protein ABA45_17870 [Marinobacter psychrophilus]